jgi:hypothetical protein
MVDTEIRDNTLQDILFICKKLVYMIGYIFPFIRTHLQVLLE